MDGVSLAYAGGETSHGASEHDLRRELAAAYRLVALFGWDDAVATHISVKLPNQNAFLINPFGMLFEEITPASLIKVDLSGNVLEPTPWKVNKAGFVIHSAIHNARPDAHCIMHLHTADGVAVSSIVDGLLPLNQTAMVIADRIAYHDYEGPALDLNERDRLTRSLGTKNLMLLRNHGTLTVGTRAAEAFTAMYLLETACTIQVRTLGMSRPICNIDAQVYSRISTIEGGDAVAAIADMLWSAMLRKLDRNCPGWSDG